MSSKDDKRTRAMQVFLPREAFPDEPTDTSNPPPPAWKPIPGLKVRELRILGLGRVLWVLAVLGAVLALEGLGILVLLWQHG